MPNAPRETSIEHVDGTIEVFDNTYDIHLTPEEGFIRIIDADDYVVLTIPREQIKLIRNRRLA